MKHIAIFATGGGSNAQKIIEHFENHETIKVSLIISNKKTAGVLEKAAVKNDKKKGRGNTFEKGRRLKPASPEQGDT